MCVLEKPRTHRTKENKKHPRMSQSDLIVYL